MSARVPQALALSVSLFRQEVAVGIRIAPYPPHGSGQADFPHPALASSGDAHSTRRIGMINSGRREPAVDESFHARPANMTFLSPSGENVMPEIADCETKPSQGRRIARHSIVADMTTHDGFQPLPHFRNGIMHAPPKFGFHLAQLGHQSFSDGLPYYRETFPSLLPTDM